MVRTDFSEALYCVVLAWHFAFVMAANDTCELCQPVAVRNLSPLKANQASVNKGLPQHLLQQTQWLSF